MKPSGKTEKDFEQQDAPLYSGELPSDKKFEKMLAKRKGKGKKGGNLNKLKKMLSI